MYGKPLGEVIYAFLFIVIEKKIYCKNKFYKCITKLQCAMYNHFLDKKMHMKEMSITHVYGKIY